MLVDNDLFFENWMIDDRNDERKSKHKLKTKFAVCDKHVNWRVRSENCPTAWRR
jgi:hypothetical protein